jgi:hypothetical protein
VPPDILATVDDYYDVTEVRVPMRLIRERVGRVFRDAQDAAIRQRYAMTGKIHLPELKSYFIAELKESHQRFGSELTRAGVEQFLAELDANPTQE